MESNRIIELSNNSPISLSNDFLNEQVKYFLEKSFSKSTKITYENSLRVYKKWCDHNSVNPLSDNHEDIARFIADEAMNGMKPSTLQTRLNAIRMLYHAHNLPNPGHHPFVMSVMKGIKRDKGMAQNKKAPATIERIEKMAEHFTDDLRGLRDKALLLIGFAGAFRRSELVSLTMADIERTPEGLKVIIRKSKTDQEGLGQTIAILNGTRLRAVDALYDWIKAANITEGLIFRSIKKGGKIIKGSLTPISVAHLIKKYASKAGFTVSDFSGHSLRSGFITSGASSGADIFKLMEVSRHKKPETVMGYVRESKLFENHAGNKFL